MLLQKEMGKRNFKSKKNLILRTNFFGKSLSNKESFQTL